MWIKKIMDTYDFARGLAMFALFIVLSAYVHAKK